MSKNIGLVWLEMINRINKNLALIEPQKIIIKFLPFSYIKDKFKNQEAQKWWLSKSLEEFKNSNKV